MSAGWDIAGACDAFAEAAIDPTRWEAALDAISAACGAEGACLMPAHGPVAVAAASASLGAATERYLRYGWNNRDERYRGIPQVMRRRVIVDFDVITPDEAARHPYYQDFLAPVGLQWFAGVKLASGGAVWIVSIQRRIHSDPFSPVEVAQLAVFSERISSAAALGRALGFARIDTAVAAFEASATAVTLIDATGKVLRLNRAAERLLGADVQIVNSRLASFDANATRALDCMLNGMLWSRADAALAPPVVLPRRDLRCRPILAHAVRMPLLTRDFLGDCRAVIVLVDLDRGRRASAAVLRLAFGLTSSEARLVAELSTGRDVQEAAARIGISYETARAQLRAIFAKTDTHRQGELVALLGRLVPSDTTSYLK